MAKIVDSVQTLYSGTVSTIVSQAKVTVEEAGNGADVIVKVSSSEAYKALTGDAITLQGQACVILSESDDNLAGDWLHRWSETLVCIVQTLEAIGGSEVSKNSFKEMPTVAKRKFVYAFIYTPQT